MAGEAGAGEALGASVLFCATLSILAPVLRTLTESFADDTIWALACSLALLHLVTHDYNYVNAGIGRWASSLHLTAGGRAAKRKSPQVQRDHLAQRGHLHGRAAGLAAAVERACVRLRALRHRGLRPLPALPARGQGGLAAWPYATLCGGTGGESDRRLLTVSSAARSARTWASRRRCCRWRWRWPGRRVRWRASSRAASCSSSRSWARSGSCTCRSTRRAWLAAFRPLCLSTATDSIPSARQRDPRPLGHRARPARALISSRRTRPTPAFGHQVDLKPSSRPQAHQAHQAHQASVTAIIKRASDPPGQSPRGVFVERWPPVVGSTMLLLFMLLSAQLAFRPRSAR